jgi:outer membrane protein TolC
MINKTHTHSSTLARKRAIALTAAVLLFVPFASCGLAAQENIVQGTSVQGNAVQSSTLSLEACYGLAKKNYPLVKQYALIEKSREYSLDNASKGTLPQVLIAGQATYQSDVTRIPISLPNISIAEQSKDQYKLYGEVSQPITDLFTVEDQKELVKQNSAVEEQKIEVELYKLRERINQVFFGVLLMDAQIQQTELLKKDIQTGIDKTNAAISNGIALKSNADVLRAELLKANQRIIELKATRKGYVDMLALFINRPVSEAIILEKPIGVAQTLSPTINRPELKLYAMQQKTFDVQNKLLADKNLPRFNVFLQGGVGRPALNVLSNDFQGYYIGGLRLSWNLSGLYTMSNDEQQLAVNQRLLDVQRETFTFNTSLSMKQQNAELDKLQELIATDNDIIQVRERIKNATKNQLDNGTATANDYLTSLNAEDQAKQTQALHQVQLLMAQYMYQTTSGN